MKKTFYFLLRVIRLNRLKNLISTLVWRFLLAETGYKTKIYYKTFFMYPNNISIGNNCLIDQNVKCTSEFADSRLLIKDNVMINRDVELDFSGDVEIRSNVVISSGVKILSHSHGYDPKSDPAKKPLVIGENTWIGARVIISENVNLIPANTIVASGSVLTKDLEGGTIIGGCPARVLKKI
jgi:acetyltransferase-like isoleucine patch superfamily enzyme